MDLIDIIPFITALLGGMLVYKQEDKTYLRPMIAAITFFLASLAFLNSYHSTHEALRQRDSARLRNDTLNLKLDSSKRTAIQTFDSLTLTSNRIIKTLQNTNQVLGKQKEQAKTLNAQLITARNILSKSETSLSEISKLRIPIGDLSIQLMIEYNNADNLLSRWPPIIEHINNVNLRYTIPGNDPTYLNALDSNLIIAKTINLGNLKLYNGIINPFYKGKNTIYNNLFADFFWTRLDIDNSNFKNGYANLQFRPWDPVEYLNSNSVELFNQIASREFGQVNFITGEVSETITIPLKRYFNDGRLQYLEDLNKAYVHLGIHGSLKKCNLIYLRILFGDNHSNAIFIDSKKIHITNETGKDFKFRLPDKLIDLLRTGK